MKRNSKKGSAQQEAEWVDLASVGHVRAGRGIQRALLTWYAHARRDLPWRGRPDPYQVWVSEIMLQQTRVETVRPYFERWMRKFPTVSALAQADEQEVLGAWQGLGYYSRARSLRRAALVVMDRYGGALPSEARDLVALPGIGPYSAGAISSIAFGRPAAIVDGNVQRVLCRLFALRGDPAKQPLARFLWKLAGSLVPVDAPGDFNQALMELGATRCTPRSPVCRGCPVARWCSALAQGSVGELPEMPKRERPISEQRLAAVVRRGKRVVVVSPSSSESRWRGLWLFPNLVTTGDDAGRQTLGRYVQDSLGMAISVGDVVHTQRHSITRYRVILDAHECRPLRGKLSAPRDRAKWVAVDELEALAMPAPHRRIARAL